LNHPAATTKPLTIDNVRENIVGIDTVVPLLDGTRRPYINLDNAASTPVLRPVLDTINEFMGWYSSVHRGTGIKSQVATHAYEQAHEVAMQFAGADPETHTVIFGKNATESLNKLAHRFPFKAGDVVITTLMEHHSNDLPWRQAAEVVHTEVDKNGALDDEHLDYLLQQYARRVKLVVVTGAANVSGYINPIHDIARKVHAAGAKILVDAAQLAPHRKVSMGSVDDPAHLDFLITASHKMYAPFGSSCLFGPKEIFLEGDPDMVGGGTVDIVTVNSVKWADLPDREEAGSPNVVGGVAQAKTMQSLMQIGMENIAAHEAELTAYLLKKLNAIPQIKVFGLSDPARAAERVGVVPLQVEGVDHYLTAAILSAEGGIGVRNGCFCAHPYLFKLLGLDEKASASYQQEIISGTKAHLPGLVRISFGCYNNSDDVDHLVEMLEKIVRRETRGHYQQDPASGAYWPQDFEIEPQRYFSL